MGLRRLLRGARGSLCSFPSKVDSARMSTRKGMIHKTVTPSWRRTGASTSLSSEMCRQAMCLARKCGPPLLGGSFHQDERSPKPDAMPECREPQRSQRRTEWSIDLQTLGGDHNIHSDVCVCGSCGHKVSGLWMQGHGHGAHARANAWERNLRPRRQRVLDARPWPRGTGTGKRMGAGTATRMATVARLRGHGHGRHGTWHGHRHCRGSGSEHGHANGESARAKGAWPIHIKFLCEFYIFESN